MQIAQQKLKVYFYFGLNKYRNMVSFFWLRFFKYRVDYYELRNLKTTVGVLCCLGYNKGNENRKTNEEKYAFKR